MKKEEHLQNFINETDDLLKELSQKITVLISTSHKREALNDIFRILHTIEGNASFFGLHGLKNIISNLENLLSAICSGTADIDKTAIDTLWKGVSLI
ncbi:MAG: Hpt domain-containing protein, partial [Candidatus Omnitrophica bacterium]|nr:Hpt domain-containing protein [Candidatus Omnitrophota bacterium]